MQKLARSDARILVYGLLADGLDVERLTLEGRQELANALDRVLDLVGEIEIVPDAVAGLPAPSVDSGNVQGWRTDFANAPTDGSDVLFQFLNHYDVPSGPLTSNIVCQWDALENGGWLNSDTLDFIEDIPVRFMLIPCESSNDPAAPGDPGYRSGGDAEAKAWDAGIVGQRKVK